MSKGLHIHWYNEIISKSNQIQDLRERMVFLRNKRNKFREDNYGSKDSDTVVSCLDVIIGDIKDDILLSASIPPPSNNVIPEEKIIDDILNRLFKLEDFELKTLKANLKGGSQYVSLTYIGTKTKLWLSLGKLRLAGIERNEIVRVFSKCYWQKTISGQPKLLDSDEIYKKIGKKGTK